MFQISDIPIKSIFWDTVQESHNLEEGVWSVTKVGCRGDVYIPVNPRAALGGRLVNVARIHEHVRVRGCEAEELSLR